MKDNPFIKGLITGIVSVIGLCVLVLGGIKIYNVMTYGPGRGNINLNELGISWKIGTIEEIIDNNAYYDVDNSKVTEYIYKGLMAGLNDKYAAYYTPEEMAREEELNNGVYRGVGVTFTTSGDDLVIKSVYEGYAAHRAGLKDGDIIKSMDGTAYKGSQSNEAISHIRTTPETIVKMEIYRPSTGETLSINVEIEQINVISAKGELKEGNIGYITLTKFDNKTFTQFKEVYEDLENKGMKGVIIDLRNNGGGIVNTTLNILSYLISDKTTLITESKGGQRTVYKADSGSKLTYPCVVLINENSASASEIFAGCMKDNEAATLIGKKSYGKGIVQNTYKMSDGSAVKFTIAKYYTPSGSDIHEQGIMPDIEVDKGSEGDAQLSKAIEVIKEKMG